MFYVENEKELEKEFKKNRRDARQSVKWMSMPKHWQGERFKYELKVEELDRIQDENTMFFLLKNRTIVIMPDGKIVDFEVLMEFSDHLKGKEFIGDFYNKYKLLLKE